MTNLNIKSEPINRQIIDRGADNFIKNNSMYGTFDNKVVYRQNISNIINNLLEEDEYNNLFMDDSKSLNKSNNSKAKKTFSSNFFDTSYQNSSKNALKH